jgi:hypothetical protein
VNHPAAANTSDQPSSSSANFSPFTCAVPLRSSDISSVPSLNLKPNPHGGTAKQITSSPYKQFVEATQKKKNQTGLRRMLVLDLQKDGREGLAGIQLCLTLHQIQTLT